MEELTNQDNPVSIDDVADPGHKRSSATATTAPDSAAVATAVSVSEPLTQEGERPQKKFYRQRAHCNPLSHNDSFEYPFSPARMKWTVEHYPNLPAGTKPTVLDIGCGFGGLIMALGSLLNEEVVLGMEIRAKLTEFVRLRIIAARKESGGKMHENCSAIRTNSMKFLPNFFTRGSIKKIFIAFPDPHFKRKNHPRRIVSLRLLSEYAYLLKESVGRLYCITDVEELHQWHSVQCDAHPLFRKLTNAELILDPCVNSMRFETEEGKKVDRIGGSKFYAVYERISDTEGLVNATAVNFFEDAPVL